MAIFKHIQELRRIACNRNRGYLINANSVAIVFKVMLQSLRKFMINHFDNKIIKPKQSSHCNTKFEFYKTYPIAILTIFKNFSFILLVTREIRMEEIGIVLPERVCIKYFL